MAASDSAGISEGARRAGRGLVAITGVKAYHIVTGYALAVLLPRLLGSPEVFGHYSKVMSALGIVNNVLVVASLQSVSRLTASGDSAGPEIFRRLLALQLILGAAVAAALFAAAPWIADFHRDGALVLSFRVVAVVPLSYALYAAAIGYLNGRQRFQTQAALDATFYTLRMIGILGGAVLLGWGALGPIAGFVVAAIAITLVALSVVGVGRGGGVPSYREWIGFMAPLWLYHALLNCILELDVQVLAKTVTELAVEAGASEATAIQIANTHVGFYHAAQTFAFVPYQLLLAMTFVVFPMVARATREGDAAQARRTIRAAMRISLLALLSVGAPIAGAADGVMRVAYPEEYLAGAGALGVLSLGLVAFALFTVAGAILTGAGRPLLTASIAAVGLVIAVVCNALFVRHAGIGDRTLAAAALGSSLGMGVVLVLAGAAVYRRFGTLVPGASLLRGCAAALAAFATARMVPHASAPLAVVALAAGFAVYGVMLLALRELTAADLQAARRIFARRR